MPGKEQMGSNQQLLEMVQELQKKVNQYEEREAERERQKRAEAMVEKAEKVAEEKARQMIEVEEAEHKIYQEAVKQAIPKKYEELKAQREEARKLLGGFNVRPTSFEVYNQKSVEREMLALLQGRVSKLEYEEYRTKALAGPAFSLEDAAWNPTGAAAEALRLVSKMGGAWQAFRRVDMTQNPMKVPATIRAVPAKIQGRHLKGNEMSVPTNDKIGGTATLDAKLIMSYYPYDRVMAEDSGPSVAGEVFYAVTQGMVAERENYILNGDAGDEADVGLLAAAKDTASGIQTWKDLVSACALLDELAANPMELVLIVGVQTYFNVLFNWEEVKNKDYTNNPVTVDGRVTTINGIAVYVSSGIPAPVFDGTSTYTQKALLGHRRAAVLGDRRSVTIETERRAKSDSFDVVGSTRVAYAPAAEDGTGLVELEFAWQ